MNNIPNQSTQIKLFSIFRSESSSWIARAKSQSESKAKKFRNSMILLELIDDLQLCQGHYDI